ncbi:MBL fold metallo-hydrolase [Myroides guanonis]|uniref:L-ascorbate metabolism protein UlaG, beta-lactamase superfamily n=1 Tax=Myroides guanonis TaxID=1150112 RepID=A0A1I3U677_9FLAO|nr:MBL fold metallo-hydrolase [Myroides guanonis]SFJ79068.1 L-ascorbate metabolism protein UlaG, beta-lactamase superfamily [Myroides guanonis]
MNSDQVYLKPNLVIEPLFDNWYAWSHLISPATAAMNITGRHLKIMGSYIQAPAAHAAAVKNPKMLGGPFIDYDGKRVDEIEQLRNDTLKSQKDLLSFSEAVRELDLLLKTKAKGYSLEPLYKEVPEVLKGYVELIYDLNNQPSFRFFEALLYNSKFYKEKSQSILLWLTDNDERPFVLSTPRLDDKNKIHLNIPFSHHGLDELSRMRKTAGSLEEIKKTLNITSKMESVFESFFTTEVPKAYEKYTGDKVRMRYFGHACILVETKDISILLDPIISYYGYDQEVERFSDMDLPETIDYVLITHNHQDHILFETLIPLRHKIRNIVVPRSANGNLQDPSLKLMFKAIGFNNVVEIDEMDTINFSDCSITGIPFIGEHSDLNIQAKICHHVRVGNFKMLFVADSCNVESKIYERVQELVGDVDVIFLGMECDGAPLSWLYGPLLTEPLARDKDSSRRLAGSNFERGKELIEAFNPNEVYVYAMGQEPWLEFISSIKYTDESHPIVQSDLLIKNCRENNIVAERLFGEKEIMYLK